MKRTYCDVCGVELIYGNDAKSAVKAQIRIGPLKSRCIVQIQLIADGDEMPDLCAPCVFNEIAKHDQSPRETVKL